MVSIEPIKNQYLTALKERQQIIDKVNEIIRDLNNLNFDDLINLNNKIEEIKTEVAQIESELISYDSRLTSDENSITDLSNHFNSFETETENTLNSKVNKSGDTITGILSITSTSGTPRMYIKHPFLDITTPPTTNCFIDQEYLDKNGKRFALIESLASGNSPTRQIGLMINSSNVGDSDNWNRLQLTHDGTSAYVTVPSWSVGTNDNSDKALTIKMANSLPSLVHTTGNETINGSKTFASRIVEQKNSDMGVEMLSTSFDRNVTITSYQRPVQFIARDKNGESVMLLQTYAESNNRRGLDLVLYDMNGNQSTLSLKSDGSKRYATSPTTPLNATSNEIATADWVISKINELATKNNLAGL